MKSIEVETLDQIEEFFLNDGDITEVLSAYARGTLSKTEVADRLEYCLMIAKQRGTALVQGPRAVDFDGIGYSEEDNWESA